MQDYIVHIVFAAAVLYLARWFWRQMRTPPRKDACGHCADNCKPTPKTDPAPRAR